MGPASWVVPGSMGQEAFDSFARPLKTGFRHCETAVKPGDTAWTGVPSKASGQTADHSVFVICRALGPRAREWEPEPPQRGAARRTYSSFERAFRRPDLSIAPGRKAAEGFGVVALGGAAR